MVLSRQDYFGSFGECTTHKYMTGTLKKKNRTEDLEETNELSLIHSCGLL